MGKYAPSKINYLYSDWHYKKLNKECYATDIDMVEVRGQYPDNLKIKALFDIKDENSLDKELTPVARAAYQEISKRMNVSIYIPYITVEYTKEYLNALEVLKRESVKIISQGGIKSFRIVKIGKSYKYEKKNVSIPNICSYCGEKCREDKNGRFLCDYCDDEEKIFTEEKYITWLNNRF